MHFDNKVVLVVRTVIPTQRVASYTIVAKRLDGLRRHLVRADHIVLDGFPALRERGTAPPSP